MQTITISTFTYYSQADADDLHICAACAHANPQLNPKPITFTHDLADQFSPLCDYCHDKIVAVS